MQHPDLTAGARGSSEVSLAGDASEPIPASHKLQEHAQRLAWRAYLRTLALQEAEPSPETTIIRNATFKVWERTFLADEVAS